MADLDQNSRDPQEFAWRSYLKRGRLVRITKGNSHMKYFTVVWDSMTPLVSHTATKNRSMELSELVSFNNLLLGMCDYTGLVFKIVPPENSPEGKAQVYQRYAIADGDGDEPKPFKIEWATVKVRVCVARLACAPTFSTAMASAPLLCDGTCPTPVTPSARTACCTSEAWVRSTTWKPARS